MIEVADESRARVLDVQRFSVHDGPGVRTTVFLAGCNLRCAWCHNPEAFVGAAGRLMTPAEVLLEVNQDRAYYAASGGGLTLSGGEPLLHVAFSRAVLAAAKDAGLSTCVQTAAATPTRNLLDVLPWVDLFQIDLKHMDRARHRHITGSDNAQIHENLARLIARGAHVEVRVPLVPGWNDDADNLDRVRAFLMDHAIDAVRLVPYQRMYLDKYRRLGLSARCADVVPPSRPALEQAAERFRQRGVAVTIDA